MSGVLRRFNQAGIAEFVQRIEVLRTGASASIDDAFVSPLHADLHQTPKGWRIENRGLNGLWVRIDAPVKLGGPSQFQCGEQRFVFVPLAG
jgi:hypothetical protein